MSVYHLRRGTPPASALLALLLALLAACQPGATAPAASTATPAARQASALPGEAPWPAAPEGAPGLANSPADSPVLPYDQWRLAGSEHFLYRYYPDSAAERDLGQIIAAYEAAYSKIVAALAVRMPAAKITCYLYPSAAVGKALAEIEPGFARPAQNEVHVLYGSDPAARHTVGHEQAHVISHYIGRREPGLDLLREGLAVYFDQSGRDVNRLPTELRRAGRLPALRDLANGFRTLPVDVAYQTSASFVAYLFQRGGLLPFRQLWLSSVNDSSGLDRALQLAYGVGLDGLERDWLRTLNG